MEEEIIALAPAAPGISNPEEGGEVETLVLKGTGIPTARIYIKTNLGIIPSPAAYVDQNGFWQVTPTGQEFETPNDNAWVYATQYFPTESGPSPTVNFKKLLSRPKITLPLNGGSLPAHEQRITGTGFPLATKIEIELAKIVPPILTYHTNTTPDGGGWWGGKPWVVSDARPLCTQMQANIWRTHFAVE
ncbi:hypothetical protein ACIPIN_26385 [Pseudomonas sp. NPDC087697]|uniref:hypothetical protein n=1 Tax=Pseudomonas sp. NPDC087697 TaxID=3364447 RepID=UPI003801D528